MSEVSAPSVGRIVHYVSYGDYGRICRAAVVTEVDENEERVCLAVFNPTGLSFNTDLDYDDSREPEGNTWHWPERM